MENTMEKTSWSDRLNPITLKEFRQSFNNKTLLITSVAVAMILIYGGSFVLNIEQLKKQTSINLEISGMALFYLATCLWIGATMLAAGVVPMFRYARERSVPDLDIGNFTAIPPHRMVCGHLLASLGLMGYVYGLCLPAFALSFMLRGMSLTDMALTHAYAFVFMLFAIQAMLSSASRGKAVHCLAVCLMCVFVLPVPICALCGCLLERDFSAPGMILALVYAVLFFGIAYMLNIVSVSAVHSNRLFGMKFYLVFCVLANIILGCYFRNLPPSDDSKTCLWICVCCYQFISLLLALVGYNSPDRIGVRLREKCPTALIPRFGYYLLSGVWGGGYLLACAALLAGYGLTAWKCPEIARHDGYIIFINAIGYILFYLVLTEIIHKFFPQKTVEVQGIHVVIFLNILPLLVFIFLVIIQTGTGYGVQDKSSLWKWLMSCSFVRYMMDAVEDQRLHFHTLQDWMANLIGVWLAAASFIAAIPLVQKQFNAFRRPTDDEWRELLTPQEQPNAPSDANTK